MPLPNTNTFTVTRDDIISAALRVMGVIGVGEVPITEDFTNCSQALNIMIKSWAKKSIPLWVVEKISLPLITNIANYPLGPTAGYVASVTATGGSGYTTGGTWTSTGGTTSVTAAGTYTVSAGKIATMVVVTPGDTYTTTPTTITVSGAGTGAIFTSVIVGITMSKPLRFLDIYIGNGTSSNVSLLPISREEYDDLGIKTTLGVPNQYYYDAQLTNGNLVFYNVPSDSTYTAFCASHRMFKDLNASTDNFDFPQEWFQALKWGLCAELCAEYGVEENKIMYIEQKANSFIAESFDWSVEEASVYFQLDYQGTVS